MNAGDLLKFDPFKFPDGGKPKPKYFIVLNADKETALLASLPTSKDHVPADVPVVSGCIDLPGRQFNCFVFLSGQQVTSTFSFPLNTFVYGSALHEYDMTNFLDQELRGETTITRIGTILPELFQNLIACLVNSDQVRRRFKKILRASVKAKMVQEK